MKFKKHPLILTLCAAMASLVVTGCDFFDDFLPTDSDVHYVTAVPTTKACEGAGSYKNSNYSGTLYNGCGSLEGQALRNKLNSIDQPKDSSYNWDWCEDADEYVGSSSKVLSLYTRHTISKNAHVSNSYDWNKWNREHIWPQGSYGKSKGDAHNYFACEGQINGIRSSYPFGEVDHKTYKELVVFGHNTGCYLGGCFEPNDSAKGEVARALMYGAVIYQYNLTDMISYENVLKWHIEHPTTQREINRNNAVQSLQGNRNPFVDHPEYAIKIWGTMNENTKVICGIN